MLKLECKFNAKDQEKAVMKAATEGIVKRVRSIRCPEHGEHAKIVATGRNSKDLSFRVSGCCQHLIDTVTGKLGR